MSDQRHPSTSTSASTDKGAALAMVLVLIMVMSFIVLPLSNYALVVARQRTSTATRIASGEATKSALRVALAEPATLFRECGTRATESTPYLLPPPMLSEAVESKCYLLSADVGVPIDSLPFGTTTTGARSVQPSGSWFTGTTAPTSGSADPSAWTAGTTAVKTAQTIWMPSLPAILVDPRSSSPFNMPLPYPACKVFFPGRYAEPITLSDSVPVYFTSGVYYFEQPVTITGTAKVVVGGGTAKGCVESDQVAAFYATDAPDRHGISGLGATFVFGGAGRLVVNSSVAGSSTSAFFNKRYVSGSKQAADSTNEVSIMTVNGVVQAGAVNDLVRPDLVVRASVMSQGNSGIDPAVFAPSTALVGSAAPIIDVSLTDSRSLTLQIPGYVSVPQGSISISTTSSATAMKTVRIFGGILAGTIDVTPDLPATFEFGYRTPVTMRTFMINSLALQSGVNSTGIVQIKESGVYSISSWWFNS